MRLTVIFTLAALSALALPAAAAAQDEAPACPEGYISYLSAGGWRCGNPIYHDGTWNDDPRDCVYGYYQGSCVPEPEPPTELPPEAYTYQMETPAPVEPAAPVRASEPTTEPVVALWLTPTELHLADLRTAR